ncbi:MAG: hypothetical protein PVI99_00045 [Anaerolineales bacterium]|jgi:hypothetical protein
MKHSQVLKRAWQILWGYRALWIFGIILAITTASVGRSTTSYRLGDQSQPDSGQSGQMEFDPDEPLWPQVFDEVEKGLQEASDEFARLLSDQNTERWARNLLLAAIIFTVVMVILFLVGKVFRYVAEPALIKMVDHYEETGEKFKARQGWRLGWSRQAWRIFLIDVVIYLPLAVVVFLFLLMALAPIITVSAGMPVRGVFGLVASIGLIMLFSLVGLLVLALVSLVKPVIVRKVVLEDHPVGRSFRAGYQMFRQAWKEYGLMWLILKGIDIVWPLVMVPFALLAAVIGVLLSGGVTFLVGGEAIQSGDPSMVWSIILGILLLVVVIGIPLAFLGGLRETYQSTSWTLTYREIRAIQALENGGGPLLEEQSSE